jgi:hypothetical protein
MVGPPGLEPEDVGGDGLLGKLSLTTLTVPAPKQH